MNIASPEPRNGRRIYSTRRSKSFADQAYDCLEELIVTLRLKPGTSLSETALVQQTGFGRTPIREALQRLAEVGLVTITPRRGTMVTLTDVNDQLLVLEVRRELERLIARSAARRATAVQRDLLAEMAREMRRAAKTDDYLLFLRIDYDFNQLSAEASGNRHLVKAILPVHALSRRFWYMHYRPYELAKASTLHALIMEAIAAEAEEEAGQASDALLDYVEEFTRAALVNS